VPKIAILAGEPSGDLIASQLMSELNKHYKNIEYIGIGGPLMARCGLKSYFDYSHLSVRGYFEVIKNLPQLLKLRNSLINYLLIQRPTIFIGIDAPDFNFAIEKKLKANNIPTFHYVAPSVWAWRKNRIYKMKECMNHLFSIFPHEGVIFKKINLPVTFVGHPLASKIPLNSNKQKAKKIIGIDSEGTIISLLPGSRRGEVRWHFDVMLKAALLINKKLKNCFFLVPVNNKLNYEYLLNKIQQYSITNIKIIFGHSHEVLSCSDISILASGTASLEAALFKKPMIIIYRMSWLSWFLLKRMHLIPYVGLPNILLDKFAVPELIQNNAKPNNIANRTLELLADKKNLKELRYDFRKLHKELKRDTSLIIIDQIKRYLK
jgi:lipid-A-disaccharide synthase